MTDRQLLFRCMKALATGTLAVVICYFEIDRPVAFFVSRQHMNQIELFRWLTYPPPTVQSWAPVILSVLLIRGAFRCWSRWERTLLTALISVIVADQFRTSLGDVCGRYWPETWFDHNPSLIGTGAYGFHPFEFHDDVGSFPSGHACRILSFSGVFWHLLPRSRVYCLAACPPLLISLVAMNYHFVGDVIGGSVLGGVVAVCAVRLSRSAGENSIAPALGSVVQK